MIETWKEYRICLTALTPIVINSGDVFNYGEIVLYKDKAYEVNLSKAAAYLSPNDITTFVSEISQRGLSYSSSKAMARLQRLVAEHPKELIYQQLEMLPEALDDYRNACGMQISRIVQDSLTRKPYIPGSSIKGSIRTAMLEALKVDKRIGDPDYGSFDKRNGGKNFEAYIYNTENVPELFNVVKDPFKYIKVSDFQFEPQCSSMKVGIVSCNPTEIYSAMTDAGVFHGGNPGFVRAHGTVSISSRIEESGLKDFADIEMILVKVRKFYVDIFNKGTKNRLQKGNMIPAWNRVIPGYSFAKDNSGYLMRLGHYSGIENVTLNVKQDMKVNSKIKNENVNTEGGVTVHLVEGMYPAGYCALTLEE